jgi:thioesterase domain-containing protein
MKAARAYVPQSYAGRVTLVRAENNGSGSPTLGWADFVRGHLTVIPALGSHDDLLIPPLLETVAAAVREALDASES